MLLLLVIILLNFFVILTKQHHIIMNALELKLKTIFQEYRKYIFAINIA